MDFLRGKITPKDWVTVALMLGVTAGLFAAFYTLVYQKKLDVIETQIVTNGKVTGDLEKAREIDSNIENYIKETDVIRSLVREFEDRLPSKRELASLLSDFEDMADAENVKIDASPLKKVLQGSKETIPFKIEASGDFHRVAGFINSLERFPRYLKITDLAMEPWDEGVATFNFTLNTYRFLQPKEIGGVQ